MKKLLILIGFVLLANIIFAQSKQKWWYLETTLFSPHASFGVQNDTLKNKDGKLDLVINNFKDSVVSILLFTYKQKGEIKDTEMLIFLKDKEFPNRYCLQKFSQMRLKDFSHFRFYKISNKIFRLLKKNYHE